MTATLLALVLAHSVYTQGSCPAGQSVIEVPRFGPPVCAAVGGGLPADPLPCGASQWVRDLASDGTLSCTSPSFADIVGVLELADLPAHTHAGGDVTSAVAAATALAADPADCSSPQFARGVNASGVAVCAQPAYSEITGTPTNLAAEPFVTSTTSGNLSAERVLSAGAGTTVNTGTAGQIKIDVTNDGHSHTGSTISALDAGADLTTGTLPVARGGTNLTAAADDNVMVGNGTTWQTKAIPSCSGSAAKLLYNSTTNTVSCGVDLTSESGVGPGDLTPVDVASAREVGTSIEFAREDHKHRVQPPVAVRYARTAAFTVAEDGNRRIDYATRIYDSCVALLGAACVTTGATTWAFTVPTGRAGLYRIEAQLQLVHTGKTGQSFIEIQATSASQRGSRNSFYLADYGSHPLLATTMYLAAGDTAVPYVYFHNTTDATSATIEIDNSAINNISITEVTGTNDAAYEPNPPLVAQLSTTLVTGSCTSTSSSCTATTTQVTCSATGGSGSYTNYAWTYVSGTTATAQNPTSGATATVQYWTRTAAGGANEFTPYSGVYRCTVTDSNAATAYKDVTVTTTHRWVF